MFSNYYFLHMLLCVSIILNHPVYYNVSHYAHNYYYNMNVQNINNNLIYCVLTSFKRETLQVRISRNHTILHIA